MAASEHPIIETRRDQMFLVLEPAEIDRLRRFGETRSYGAGERLATTGEVGPGMFVILTGNVVVTRRDELAHHPPIVTYGPGSFLGELAQLSGRPALVDGHTQGTVEALVIPPHKLRDVLVEEAELGERIIRALILRRVGLLETGSGGPVIIGRADHRDVLRLEGFLARNGHPHQRLDPETDPGANALLERFRASTESEHLKQLAFARQRYPENRLRITPPQWNGYKPPASSELNVPIPLDMLAPVARLATNAEVVRHKLAPAAGDWRTAPPPVRQRPRGTASSETTPI